MNVLKIWSQEIARWFYWFPLRWLVQCLPLWVNHFVGSVSGIFMYWTAKGKKREVFEGIRGIFGESLDQEAIKNIAKRTFDHRGKDAIENLLCCRLDKKVMKKMIIWEGLNNLEEALSLGRGAILMHGHFGNEELIMPAVGFQGYRMNQLASRWRPDAIDGRLFSIPNLVRKKIFELKIGTREKYPVKFIYIDNSLREVFECLRRNEILTVAMDGREGSKWISVEFLGKKGVFSPGPMHIALRTKAPIIPVFILRDKGYGHRLIFHRAFGVEKTGNRKRDILYNTQRFVYLMEGYIRKYPCHYMKMFWVKERFFKDEVGSFGGK